VHFLWNILLALVWCLLQGEVDLPTLAIGFVVGFLALRVIEGPHTESRYFGKPRKFLAFFVYFLREMHVAQFRVVHDVVTVRHRSNPGIIAMRLDARTDAEIAFLACIISLTPGTMALEVSRNRRLLYLHVMFIPEEDPGRLIENIKARLERPLLDLMR
jgi:multicomponent Na+:H+ antiporter subunit E